MAEIVNTFAHGMASDLSLSIPQKDTYLHAENFRIVTEKGGTTAALVNVKGTTQAFTIPNTSSVDELALTVIPSFPVTYITSLTIDGRVDTPNFTVNTLEEFYEALASFINSSAQYNPNGSTQQDYKAYARSTSVLIYSPTQTVVAIVYTTADLTKTTIVAPKATFFPIGYTVLRDTLVLYTTNDEGKLTNPGGIDANLSADPASAGQIWKVDYDTATDTFSINTFEGLRYNNIVNFSLFHGIPTTGASVGRYEIPTIQRVFWTDWFNPPRRFNIADPLGFGLEPSLLTLIANTVLNVPILQEVKTGGGGLKTGSYSVAYRLTLTSGASTVFSLPSNPVYIVPASEITSAFQDLVGAATSTPTSKSIKYTINNVDTNYDRIQILSIYRETLQATPKIELFLDENITDSTFTFDFTGLETAADFTIDEYLAEPLVFNKVKTLNSKTNRLLVGNVIYNDFDISFDARAYRWISDQSTGYNVNTTHVADEVGNLTTVNKLGNSLWNVPATHDAINPNDSPSSRDNYLYKSDGQTFGGTGPKVSYRFVDDSIVTYLDSYNLPTAEKAPYVRLASDSTTFDLNTTFEQYPHVKTYRDNKSPYVSSLLTGYMRDEVYRFGIVFFSKKHEPSFVKWVGDIRMPHTYMPDRTISGTTGNRQLTFGLTNYSAPNAYGKPMAIEFTVDISGLQDTIEGFSIVRVKREDKDKTILGQGVLYPSFIQLNGDTPDPYTPNYNDHWLFVNPQSPAWIFTESDGTTLVWGGVETAPSSGVSIDGVMSFNCPDFLFKSPPGWLAGDYIDIACLLDETDDAHLREASSIDMGDFKRVFKFMSPNTTTLSAGSNNETPMAIYSNRTFNLLNSISITAFNTTQSIEIHVGSELPRITNYAGSLGLNYNYLFNTAAYTTVSGALRLPSAGSAGMLLKGDFFPYNSYFGAWSEIDLVTRNDSTPISGGATKLYLGNYKRPRTSQYGGNTFQKRSLNLYILANHYQPLQAGTTSYTNLVYGGDTYVSMFDNVKQFPNRWDALGGDSGIGDTYDNQFAEVVIAPIETYSNIEMRYGTNVPNKRPFSGLWDQQQNLDSSEDFTLNTVSDCENDLVTFFPRPEPFIFADEFDTRIHSSEAKINGERTDSWSIFKDNVYIDVEGIYGPINNLVHSRDDIYFFQDKAFGIVAINPRALLQDTTGSALQVGTGDLLSRYDYVSNEVGCKHQWGMSLGNTGIYFLSANKSDLYCFSKDIGLSSLAFEKGLSGFFREALDGNGLSNDTPLLATTNPAGAQVIFDNNFWQVLLNWNTTASGTYSQFDLSYGELVQAFNSFYTFSPSLMLTTDQALLSFTLDPTNRNIAYRHNTGPYGLYYTATAPDKSTVKLVINESPTETKKYNVFSWVTDITDRTTPSITFDLDTWTRLRVYDDRQNSDWINLVSKPLAGFNVSRLRKREWTTHVPRNAVISTLINPDIFSPASLNQAQLFKPRMTNNYLIADLEYDNSNDRQFTCPYVSTEIEKVF